jgi:hypothetical protein
MSETTDYSISVEMLRYALDQLLPTDRITGNAVGNLLVLRDGVSLGYIQVRGHLQANEVLELWVVA